MLPQLIRAATLAVPEAPTSASPFNINEYPVIGVVTQPLPSEFENDPRFAGKKSYVMQAYVLWLESSGARVIPLVNEDTVEETDKKLAMVNGVLFPGGDGDYLAIGDHIY